MGGPEPNHALLSSNSKHAHAALLDRTRRIKIAAEMGLARSSSGRHWSRALRRRLLLRRKGVKPSKDLQALISSSSSSSPSKAVEEDLRGVGESEDDDAPEVDARVRALQRLVPGGEELGVEPLFEETADYIEALQGQVTAMRALVCLLDGIEREKRMMGG